MNCNLTELTRLTRFQQTATTLLSLVILLILLILSMSDLHPCKSVAGLFRGEKLSQRVSIRQRGARPQVATLQRRDCVCELQAGLDIFAAQQSKKKSAVKGISRDRRIAAPPRHCARGQ